MKKLLIVAFLLSGMIAFAQNDEVKTTKIKKTTEVKNGEVINTKVKVITEKKQEVKFAENQKHQLNQDRVMAPIAVTKTFMIDNDKDPFYDKVTKVKYYNMNDKKYAFQAEGNALNISYLENEKEVNIGKAVRSKYNNYYVISTKEMNGVGYFTKDNDFIIEYYDTEAQDTKVVMFEDLKF